MCDIDTDPPAMQFLRRMDRGPAPAKWIEHYVALIRRSRDDALQKRERFLRWIAESLIASGRRNVNPAISNCPSLRVMEILLILWHCAWFQLYNDPVPISLLHSLLRPSPHAFHAEKFVSQIRAVVVWVKQWQETVDTFIVRIFVSAFNIIWVMLLVELMEGHICTFGISENRIGASWEIHR